MTNAGGSWLSGIQVSGQHTIARTGVFDISLNNAGLAGVDGAKEAIRRLTQTPFSTSLDLTGNPLEDHGVDYLVKAIAQLAKTKVLHLQHLGLGATNITDKGLDAIVDNLLAPASQALPNPAINVLGLSGNMISLSPQTASNFAEALSHPFSCLREIDLAVNGDIGGNPANLKAFFQHLNSPSLERISLRRCYLRSEDAAVIARWLQSSQSLSLRSVGLQYNFSSWNRYGAHRIARVIYSGCNTSLIRLGLEPFITSEDDRPFNEETDNADIPVGDRIATGPLDRLVAAACRRNSLLTSACAASATRALIVGRILLHAKPAGGRYEQASEADLLSRTFKFLGLDSEHSHPVKPGKNRASPLLKLPFDAIVEIVHQLAAMTYPVLLPPSPRDTWTFDHKAARPVRMVSPLSIGQVDRIVAYAQDKRTFRHLSSGGSTNRPGLLSDREQFLSAVGCSRYEHPLVQ